jgi:heat shock protein HslJ
MAGKLISIMKPDLMKKIFLIIAAGIFFISCHSAKKSSGTENTTVDKNNTASLNGNWQLEMLFASDNKWEKPPHIKVNTADSTFSGNTSCNSIRGKFAIDGNYLGFDKNFISTRMACPGSYEKAFLSALLKINRYSINKDELALGQGEIVLMKFRRTYN